MPDKVGSIWHSGLVVCLRYKTIATKLVLVCALALYRHMGLVLPDDILYPQTDVYSIYNGDYETVVYTANSDQTSRVENLLPAQFIVTHLRIYPLTWHVYPSMRAEVMACEPDGKKFDDVFK